MRSQKVLVSFIFIGTLLVLSSCASTNLPPIGAKGKTFEMEEDEKDLWKRADKLENQLENAEILYNDPALERYLDILTKKLLRQNAQIQDLKPRIRVIKNPFPNAVSLPNGAIYLNTGILARMENEAQFAVVIGHELTHYTNRHALKWLRNARNKVALMRTLRIIFATTGGGFGVGVLLLGDDLGALWVLASIIGYSKELETEADETGLRLMSLSGYDSMEASRFVEHLIEESNREEVKEPFFYGIQPRLQEWLETCQKFTKLQRDVRPMKDDVLINSEPFMNQIGELLLDNAKLDLRMGRFKVARECINRNLQRSPQNARAHFMLGEFHRWSGQDNTYISKAIDAYLEAAHLDRTFSEPHRELGFLYRKQNLFEQARAEFELYVSLSPEAVDAPIVRGYIEELKKP
jgi:Zn-dependent protease with chaperone function